MARFVKEQKTAVTLKRADSRCLHTDFTITVIMKVIGDKVQMMKIGKLCRSRAVEANAWEVGKYNQSLLTLRLVILSLIHRETQPTYRSVYAPLSL